MYVLITFYQIYKAKQSSESHHDFSASLCLFSLFTIIGLFEMMLTIGIRFSFSGRVCSGDFIKNDQSYKYLSKYYIRGVGNFVLSVSIWETISFITIIVSFMVVNRQITIN